MCSFLNYVGKSQSMSMYLIHFRNSNVIQSTNTPTTFKLFNFVLCKMCFICNQTLEEKVKSEFNTGDVIISSLAGTGKSSPHFVTTERHHSHTDRYHYHAPTRR